MATRLTQAGEEVQEILNEASRFIDTTYNELVELHNRSILIPGSFYRITDYITATTQANTQSAGHPFDIIVLALSKSELSEQAWAIQSARDTDGYFANSKLIAWQIWYCLDNDVESFVWADTENGKGVIYRMIDEYSNDCPYDFKNIQFQREDEFYYTFSSLTEDHSLTETCYKNIIKEYIADGIQQLNEIVFVNTEQAQLCRNNAFNRNCRKIYFGHSSKDNSFGVGCYSNTFGNECEGNNLGNFCWENNFGNSCIALEWRGWCRNNTVGSNNFNLVLGNYCDRNSFGDGCYANKCGNNFVDNILGSSCNSNKFADNCANNKFGDKCDNNQLGYSCSRNTFGRNCTNNTLNQWCTDNNISEECSNNQFGSSCTNNNLGERSTSNSFGAWCTHNILGYSCYANKFGNSCNSNTLGDYNFANIFGNNCSTNILSITFTSNVFGNYCSDNKTDAAKTHYRNNVFADGVSKLTLISALDGSDERQVQNYRFTKGLSNARVNVIRGLEYETMVALNSLGEVKQFCIADIIV